MPDDIFHCMLTTGIIFRSDEQSHITLFNGRECVMKHHSAVNYADTSISLRSHHQTLVIHCVDYSVMHFLADKNLLYRIASLSSYQKETSV